ncbi:hypothetical protein F5877DRAFT_84451 [Lentinula edodes]|nr:hypothetical protein F5877DRAFT_84451 [Lentinula edodes]
MNPYSNFDHRPLCADHKEIHTPSKASNPTDHVVISPSSGPTRTQKTSRRASPYSSPSPDPEPLPVRHNSPSPPSTLSLFSSIESLSSELEHDSDRERLARSRSTRRVSFVSDNGSSTFSRSRDHSASTTEHTSTSNSTLNDSAPKNDGRKARTSSAEKKHDPPPLVFEDDSDDDFLIPKPPGEVGRPGRGGYSLFEVLSWPRKKYDKVKKYINKLVEDNLDCELPMSEQRAVNVKKVRDEAVAKYVFLKEYRGFWALDDFIRNHLKYQKSVLRRQKLEKMVADVRPAVVEMKGAKRTAK